ncbi:hypothetical protein EVG20_g4089 [Dentipellis fragilis]|uniref:NAD(P)-binding domain-containing protein n=1 Tax=Dentipellis fragilis TaxID=205917 RepID=A0A4Y9Z0V6_9AGAM|nr:hypothetical protein EVG20_g4089 [Dentipellis fragilis]
MASAAKSALLVGATGAVGKHLLQELLISPQFNRVGEFGRRVTAPEQLAGLDDAQKAKLQQKAIDFEKIEQEGLKDGKWDVVFITLGTTAKKAGSSANFEKIDREYVINAAKAAQSADPDHLQRLVYLSSVGSNPNSSSLYTRSKGLTERGLAALGYSDTVIFRPAFLMNAERSESRLLEDLAIPVASFLSRFSSNLGIDVARLAKSIRIAGQLGSEKLPPQVQAEKRESPSGKPYVAINNSGALKLAEMDA